MFKAKIEKQQNNLEIQEEELSDSEEDEETLNFDQLYDQELKKFKDLKAKREFFSGMHFQVRLDSL